MEALIKTGKNRAVTVVLDQEAARAMFASVIFAARFHEDIVPLAQIIERRLDIETDTSLGDIRHANDLRGT